MKLILTHEQADLDALASMLGARLLDKDAIALLPRNINRNALTFIKNYQAELAFMQFDNLPKEAIKQITLVDTQSLITLKGINADTLIKVIDHHPLKEGINPNWDLEINKTGACATLLVEKIQKAALTLTPIQATTLLLGIYEDTGSLSYSATTSRDLCAAAFLLKQGADLSIIKDYLNPPLSSSQQGLYDRLMRNLETYKIQNQTILTATANAQNVKDEVSSVAHKLRDFLGPDALLLMVLTKQGIRLVARSTTDAVDVSKIANAFGGGGHARAASALIRPKDKLNPSEYENLLENTYRKMIFQLPNFVKPVISVRQIMSKSPLILAPDTPVDEISRLMQRYGFEGYPVVEKGKIVGLLNRRTVDRALNHKMSVPASSLMEAGNISIYPDDSLEHLQKLMAASGWGQIPVIDPQNGEIIGIVTRTDLIKTRSPKELKPDQAAIVENIKQAVPAARLALLTAVAREADRLNFPIYIVGGFVRDLLLGRPSLDFDIVIEGDAIYFVKKLVKAFGGRAVSHSRFGTAKWYLAEDHEKIALSIQREPKIDASELPEHLDLITARTEFYERPAALPTIESSSIKMDLHRRDFTINTLALRLDGEHFGEIIDHWGGLVDLEDKKIRVLHALSFVDDATRLLRAVRFEQRFNFEIEERTLALLKESLPLLDELSGTRLRHELELILAEQEASQMLSRLNELGIIKVIHPSLPWNPSIAKKLKGLDQLEIDPQWKIKDHMERLSIQQVLGFMCWLSDVPKDELQSLSSRLRFSAKLANYLQQAGALQHDLSDLISKNPSQIYHRLVNIPRLVIYAVYHNTPEHEQREILWTYISQYAKIKPITSGKDLLKRGLEASPMYGEILGTLRDAWLDGEIQSAEEEKARLEDILQQHK